MIITVQNCNAGNSFYNAYAFWHKGRVVARCDESDYHETIDGIKHAGVKFVQILDTDADLMTIKVYAMSSGALLTSYEIAESRIGFRMGCDDPQGQLILRNMKMLDGQDALDFIASL